MTITLTRAEDGTFTLRHDEPFQDAVVYAGTSPDKIDQPVARASGTQEISITGLDRDRRYYFIVELDDGQRRVVAERRLPLSGSLNFRDLGGYATTDGKHVRWGRVYRSDALDRLTDEDMAYLDRLGLRIICDLRGDNEVAQRPSKLRAREMLRLPIRDEVVTGDRIRAQLERGDVTGLDVDLMIGSYRRLLDNFPSTFGDVLRRLANPDNLPALFHCTAGKDRTGLTAAMLLSLLGVPRETIRTDYDLTNGFVKPFMDMVRARMEAFGVEFEPLTAIFGAPPVLLQTAFEHLDTEYGGVEAYLRDKAGVDDATVAALKANLLM